MSEPRHVSEPIDEFLLELLVKEHKRRRKAKQRLVEHQEQYRTDMRAAGEGRRRSEDRLRAAEEALAAIHEYGIEATTDPAGDHSMRAFAIAQVEEYSRKRRQNEI